MNRLHRILRLAGSSPGKLLILLQKKPLGNLTGVVAHHCVSNVDWSKSVNIFWEIEEIPRVKHLI